jgi:hypothetical protein
MQLNLPLLPNIDGKKNARLTIAITQAQKNFLSSIIRAYEARGTRLTESEFVYIAFVEGLKGAVGALSFPTNDYRKIF